MKCIKIVGLVLAVWLAAMAEIQAAQQPLRVLFVGGDWKAQLPNYHGTTPLRGHFVRQEVDKAAPGRFAFTLWTSYEFLQYGDTQSLKRFDAIVVGDTMRQSVMPRLVRGLTAFVQRGGGFLYCDNHKAFSFNTRELSFDEVLPIGVVPFRPYDEGSQPICTEKPLATAAAMAQPGQEQADHLPLQRLLADAELPRATTARQARHPRLGRRREHPRLRGRHLRRQAV